ncbi:hypothetical protein WUBG_12032 [Wuchereria bancrofti]|uniref:Uncharacterized protein n=1 Tax=Wuchereria bancrofti TaxID=6293 RepID=J9ARQ0_WUCBA|nr:hypothetical protein WUBG_12032 [Wuchereria bancrofti]
MQIITFDRGLVELGATVFSQVKVDLLILNHFTFKTKRIPESDRHHFGIYHIPAPEGATCAGAWAEHYGPPQGELRMKVFFQDAKERSPPKNSNENASAKDSDSKKQE